MALCERRGDTQNVSMLLIGAQAPGAKVLVYLGSASACWTMSRRPRSTMRSTP